MSAAQGTPHLPPAGLEDALYYAALSDSKTPGSGAVIVTAGALHIRLLLDSRLVVIAGLHVRHQQAFSQLCACERSWDM